MDDTGLIQQLCDSFTRQCGWYGELTALTQGAMGKLALSRGDLGPVAATLVRKQAIIDEIAGERERIQDLITSWQERKQAVGPTTHARMLDDALARTQTAIAEFLRHEEHMKTYLQHCAQKGSGQT